MYKVAKFLKDLGSHIKTKIEQAENGGVIDADMLEEIEELCNSYNAVRRVQVRRASHGA